MRRLARAAWPAFTALLMATPAMAQDATERAGELKAWREQCNDPDADLRMAYLEAAIASGDQAVVRICVRQSLDSDDADIRNLGLRAALASISQLSFDVTMPSELAAAYKKAGSNQDQLKAIESWYVARQWFLLKTGLSIAVVGAELSGGTSTWYPLVNVSGENANYQGKATVVGDRVTWIGSASVPVRECRLSLGLVEGGRLDGTLQCGDLWAFQVSANLL
jgi:hypothetical protein